MFFVVTQAGNFVLLWWLVGSLPFAALLWVGTRLFAVWVNMVQNYWTHERRWGYRRYEDDDNAMNIGDWLPVVATFSACLQNNHHHSPQFLRLSHEDSEFDFGFMTVKVMKTTGPGDRRRPTTAPYCPRTSRSSRWNSQAFLRVNG